MFIFKDDSVLDRALRRVRRFTREERAVILLAILWSAGFLVLMSLPARIWQALNLP